MTEISRPIIKRQYNNALHQAVSHRYKRLIVYDVTSLSLCLKKIISQVGESRGDSGKMSFFNKMVEISLISLLAVEKPLYNTTARLAGS